MLRLADISHGYGPTRSGTKVLDRVNLVVERGSLCALTGASGSGKSTLLNVAGLLDLPSSGSVTIDDIDASTLGPQQRAELRNHKIGFVFQSFHLLPRLTAQQNVALPLLHRGEVKSVRLNSASAMLERVGLSHRQHHRPEEMSGGQRQRVAIARALVGRPQLILADEPTGNLDRQTGNEIIALLREVNLRHGVTILIVTHDPQVAEACDRTIVMSQGRIVEGVCA